MIGVDDLARLCIGVAGPFGPDGLLEPAIEACPFCPNRPQKEQCDTTIMSAKLFQCGGAHILVVATRWRSTVMDKSASRRRFLQHMTALGAFGSTSAGLAASDAGAAEPRQIAQAQPDAAAARQKGASETAGTRGLPRIQLMIGPGTLPSIGKDRMDLLRYRLSGNPRLTGEQMLEPLPEIAKMARVDVDKGNPYAQATHDD